MKHQLTTCFTKALLLAGISACSTALAQSPVAEKCHEPNSQIKFTAKFGGADAAQLKTAQLLFQAKAGTPPADQQNFQSGFWSDASTNKPTPSSFEITLTIPEYAATGEYAIMQLNASTGGISLQYSAPREFTPPPPFQVCNPKHFRAPSIDSVTESH